MQVATSIYKTLRLNSTIDAIVVISTVVDLLEDLFLTASLLVLFLFVRFAATGTARVVLFVWHGGLLFIILINVLDLGQVEVELLSLAIHALCLLRVV